MVRPFLNFRGDIREMFDLGRVDKQSSPFGEQVLHLLVVRHSILIGLKRLFSRVLNDLDEMPRLIEAAKQSDVYISDVPIEWSCLAKVARQLTPGRLLAIQPELQNYVRMGVAHVRLQI
ncbi:MAG: hypothetical protein AB7V46_11540 [Thermomicrobiales bacterium]